MRSNSDGASGAESRGRATHFFGWPLVACWCSIRRLPLICRENRNENKTTLSAVLHYTSSRPCTTFDRPFSPLHPSIDPEHRDQLGHRWQRLRTRIPNPPSRCCREPPDQLSELPPQLRLGKSPSLRAGTLSSLRFCCRRSLSPSSRPQLRCQIHG